MTVEIISATTCPFAQRTRLALLEKGIEHRVTEIDLDAKPDWFLEISPYGKVPVVRHGDATLFESSIVNEYLDEVFPETPLLPRDPAQRARARVWIDFANTRFVPHVYKLMLAQDAAGQAHQAAKLTDALLAMEERGLGASPGPYWLGETISLVDLTFQPHLQRFCALEHYRDFRLPESCVRLKAWLALMAQRPSVVGLTRPDEVYIRNWSKYADNSGQGTTARDMREA